MSGARPAYPDGKLKRSVALYCDYLGVENVSTSAQAQAFADRLRSSIDEAEHIKGGAAWDSRWFSDCVLVGWPLDVSMYLTTASWYATEAAADLQTRSLVRDGLFLRGGIAVGDLCIYRDLSFGGALVDAYRMERDRACLPRVIVDPAIAGEIGEQVPWTWQDEDDEWFVDYLGPFRDRSYRDEAQEIFEAHFRVIRESLDAANTASIRNKFVWAAHYHDTASTELLKDGGPAVPLFELSERTSYPSIPPGMSECMACNRLRPTPE